MKNVYNFGIKLDWTGIWTILNSTIIAQHDEIHQETISQHGEIHIAQHDEIHQGYVLIERYILLQLPQSYWREKFQTEDRKLKIED